jgi:hypothetical protein
MYTVESVDVLNSRICWFQLCRAGLVHRWCALFFIVVPFMWATAVGTILGPSIVDTGSRACSPERVGS